MNQPKNKKPAPLAGGGTDRTEPGQGGVVATPNGSTAPPDRQPDFLRAALWYAQHGWRVFPCRPGGKEPLVPNGCKEATADETVIRGWWEHWPDANIGIHPGPSGLVVLDVDVKNGGEGLNSWNALRARFGAVLDETVMARTPSGGLHIYYQTQGLQIRNATETNSPLGPGISVRFDGLYVVAPPGRTAAGGYSWLPSKKPSDRQPAPMPEGLVALLAGGKSGAATEHPTPPAGAPHLSREGQRNNTLTSLAGSMRRRGMAPETIEKALLEENKRRCDPPLPDEEVRRIAASVGRYPPEEAPSVAEVAVLSGDDKDFGNANALESAGFANRFRWATHRAAWMRWTSRNWLREIEEAVANEAAATLRRHYATLLADASDKETVRDLTRKLREICSYSRVIGALSFLRGRPGIKTLPEEWDRYPHLFNTNNGTMDTRTIALRPHDPNDLLTQLVPVDYDPEATCPRWLQHLETFLPDPEVRRQVQRDLGCSLVGDRLRQILPIWWGTGGNGKSTTLIVIRNILGDYAKMAAPELLISSKHGRHPSELADLCGSRVVFASETAGGASLYEDRLKTLCGGENVKARYMGRDWFEFPRTWTIFLVTNHKPQVRGKDPAIWRRLRLVPWTVALPEEKQRPQEHVIEELMEEAVGILAWMMEGLIDWQRNPDWVAPAVRAATGQYQEEQNILGPFLADRCELGPRHTAAAGELYEAYLDWCGRNSEDPVSKDRFTKQLSALGFSKERRGHSGVRVWVGLRLKKASGTTDADGVNQPGEEQPIELIIPDGAAEGGW